MTTYKNLDKYSYSRVSVIVIILISFIFPTLELLLKNVALHRIPYVITLILAILAVTKRGYICKDYLFVILLTFGITSIGLITVGTQYTSFLSPLINGILFYLIIGSNYKLNFVLLYKLLISTIFIEFIYLQIFGNELLHSILNSKVTEGYVKLGGKSSELLRTDILVPNSIFYGSQAASMIIAISIFVFKDIKLWRYLSIILLFFCFTFTAITMVLVGLYLNGIKKKHIISILIIFTLSAYLFITPNKIGFMHYYGGWVEFPLDWLNKPLFDQLFGYPFKTNTAYAHEFGYFFILKNLGIIVVSIVILMNLYLIKMKNNNITTIVTMYHISLIHYPEAFDMGVTQLFGLHIAHALYSVKNNYNYGRTYLRTAS